jgi:hypothetical protein
MTVGKFFLAALIAQSIAIVASGAAKADVIYTYTGNDFTTANSPYTTSDKITGTITLSSALGLSLVGSSVSPLAYSFSDGIVTLASPTCCNLSSQTSFVFNTDASGNITNWNVVVQANANANEFQTADPSSGLVFDETLTSGSLVHGAENLSDPGTWSLQAATTSVPEPASLALFAPALLGLAFFYRQKRAIADA